MKHWVLSLCRLLLRGIVMLLLWVGFFIALTIQWNDNKEGEGWGRSSGEILTLGSMAGIVISVIAIVFGVLSFFVPTLFVEARVWAFIYLGVGAFAYFILAMDRLHTKMLDYANKH